jgi:NAD(P)-dependent dehydrogenase (short-subunit alcohol dehydrogenase family)
MADVSADGLERAIEKVKTTVGSFGGRLSTQVVDVSKEEDVEKAVTTVDGWGGVDVMFNNAGIMHPKDGDAEDCPDSIWDLTMNINVRGVWYGSKYAIRSLRKFQKTKGSIINTASMVPLLVRPLRSSRIRLARALCWLSRGSWP